MSKKYNDMPIIKERLKGLLKEKGISQLQLSSYLGINKDYLNASLRKGFTNEATLISIGKYLDVHPLYLSDENVPRLYYGAYETWNYDFDDCVRGLILMMQYSPGDYSQKEVEELKHLVGRTIDRYSAMHNKKCFDMAFWVNESDPDVQ